MNIKTIKIGIDLGTTNSSVAINNNGNIEIVKKPGGVEFTPSIFGFDKAKNKVVGQKAYKNIYDDPTYAVKNYKSEVKRIMGTSETFLFENAGVEMNAEEISAEILKNLKEDILRKYPDFNTVAAVITVPAAFSILQSEATKRAGNIAGFKYVVLLQEPIAAAMSYGFGSSKNENWLIYDLGGGTFDVALISSKDGVLSVLGHNGDNFLGGKNIDMEIVDKIIVPRIVEKFSLTDFSRNNEKFQGLFSKLKIIAECAKIELSQYDNYSIVIDDLGKDDNGKDILLSFDFIKKDFEKLIKPFIERTLDLSKETLRESGIKNTSVNKIVLVGGPTQIPYIRERLQKDLKIEVDASVDPLTVVAKGACVFAISQKIPQDFLLSESTQDTNEAMTIKLNYETLTSETEESISGVVEGLKDSDDEYYIQFQSESGSYDGSRIRLKNGKFFDTVALEPNRSNIFWIYLFDRDGNSLPVDTDSFVITHGLSVSGAPIPHSIGIAVAHKNIKNSFMLTEVFEKIFEKGSILPLKQTENFKTVRRLSRNENENSLWIKIGEGESETPSLNTFTCELGIKGMDLPYDLPEGTDIEITVEVNESRELFVTAYIPLVDLTLNARATLRDEIIDLKNIEAELKVQSDRANGLKENCSIEERNKLSNAIESVRVSLSNASLDEDEKRKANKQLKDLKISLDELEKAKEMPQLIKEHNEAINSAEKIITEFADRKDIDANNDQLKSMRAEGEKAISENDKTILVRVNEQINELAAKALFSNPATWVYHFQKITEGNKHFINDKEAKYFIEKGKRSIELGDIDELKRCCHNLLLLLPSEEQEIINNNLSGITR